MEYRGFRYVNLNAIVGVLTSALVEFQRRVVDPYEDEKLLSMGFIMDLMWMGI